MFSARTNQSGKLKALFEILFSNGQDFVLVVSKSGIETELNTINNATLCVALPAEEFDSYNYTYDESMYVGLGSHVNTFFKSLKNKSVITLSISKPYTLDIHLLCSDNHSITYSASFMCAQNVSPAPTYDYDLSKCFELTTTAFNHMCKAFSKIEFVDVTILSGQLVFSFELAGIDSKRWTFGIEDGSQKLVYFKKYKSDIFIRLGKLSSFANKNIKICYEVGKPLMLLAESSLGVIKTTINADEL